MQSVLTPETLQFVTNFYPNFVTFLKINSNCFCIPYTQLGYIMKK
jgi:hypothetical protein